MSLDFPVAQPWPSAPVGRIVPDGLYFVDADGKLVIRKSITCFTAPKRFAEGRGDDARRFFDWAASKGFNEVRCFASVDWTGPPNSGVETGWPYNEAASQQTITEAAARGLRVELVALTYDTSLDDMVLRLRRVDDLCAANPTALLECANEPSVNGIDMAAVLEKYTPRTPAWASGQGTPVPLPQPVVTHHSPRKPSWARCFKDALEFNTGAGPEVPFTPPFPGPVMLDEPPQVEQTIRDAPAQFPAADDWEAYGAGAAFFAAGACLHGHPTFQRCEIPTDPAVLECVDAFVRGLNTPPLQRYRGYNRYDQPTPGEDGSRRYTRWGEDNAQYIIDVRPYAFFRV